MNKIRIIPIFNQVDVHAARMYTREAARQIGMELIDQARISLATSSLAECLKMTNGQDGKVSDVLQPGSQIVIRIIEENEPTGIQVDLIGPDCCSQSEMHQIEKVRQFVDEIRIDDAQENGVHITLIKWVHSIATVEPQISEASPREG